MSGRPLQSASWLAALVTLGVPLLTGCASPLGAQAPSTAPGAVGRAEINSRIRACKAGDTEVASESQCLRDDATCYAIAGGRWCTGPRGNTCPTGSVKISTGTPCPANTRCFAIGESLMCGVQYQ